jgi:hypothetical protein
MAIEAAPLNRATRFDAPFIVVCAVAVAACIVAYLQYQRAIQLTADLAAAKAHTREQATVLQAESKPDLPLSVGFRPAILGASLVMELRNNSASELEIAAVFSSDATGQLQRRNLVLPPNRIVNVGSSEGWAFAPGQRVTFSNASYRAVDVIVPPAKR